MRRREIDVLISAVQKQDVLWNKLDRNYKNKRFNNAAWDIVAKETGMTREKAKAKWKNLRDTYLRELRKIDLPTLGHSNEGVYTGKWIYFDLMAFLIPNLSRQSEEKVSIRTTAAPLSPFQVHNMEVTDYSQHSLALEEEKHVEEKVEESYRVFIEQQLEERGESEKKRNEDVVEAAPPKRSARLPKMTVFEEYLLQEANDEDMIFLKSLAPFMKKLNGLKKLKVRNEFHRILLREVYEQE